MLMGSYSLLAAIVLLALRRLRAAAEPTVQLVTEHREHSTHGGHILTHGA